MILNFFTIWHVELDGNWLSEAATAHTEKQQIQNLL